VSECAVRSGTRATRDGERERESWLVAMRERRDDGDDDDDDAEKEIEERSLR